MIQLDSSSNGSLERRLAEAVCELQAGSQALLESIPGGGAGSVSLAALLGVEEEVLSRLKDALARTDPLAVAYHLPGAPSLRHVCRMARRRGANRDLVERVETAVEDYRALLSQEVGDRSALEVLLARRLPEVRRDFELLQKQAAFRALSQLRGASAETLFTTALLHPSPDGVSADLVWIFGLLGLRRLRPGARVQLSTRRLAGDTRVRLPRALDRRNVEGLRGARLDRFCDQRPAEFEVRRSGATVHYLLEDARHGPRALSDLILTELNQAEMPRELESQGRRAVFMEVPVPARTLIFDVLVHHEVTGAHEPRLHVYDTSFEGVADVNDRARVGDRCDLDETLERLPARIEHWRTPEIPNYTDLLRHVLERAGWEEEHFRAHRCRIDYPLYGTQIVVAFGGDDPTADLG